jgi:hypothetical protein
MTLEPEDCSTNITRAVSKLRQAGASVSDDLTFLSFPGEIGYFQDSDIAELRHLPHLNHVELVSDHLTDAGLEVILELKELDAVGIGGEKLSSEAFRYLRHLPCLNYVEVFGRHFGNDIIPHLVGIDKLKYLDLAETKINDLGVEQLCQCTSLETIVLSNTNVTDKSIPFLTRLNLNCLYLEGTFVTDEAIPQLAKLQTLARLGLGEGWHYDEPQTPIYHPFHTPPRPACFPEKSLPTLRELLPNCTVFYAKFP